MSGIAGKRVEEIIRRSANGDSVHRCKKACSGSGEGFMTLNSEDLDMLRTIAKDGTCESLIMVKDNLQEATQRIKEFKDQLSKWTRLPEEALADAKTKQMYKVVEGKKTWKPELPKEVEPVYRTFESVKSALKEHTISFSKNSFQIVTNLLQCCVKETMVFLIDKCVDSSKRIVKEQILVSKKRKAAAKKSKRKPETTPVISYKEEEITGLVKLAVETNSWGRLKECLLSGEPYCTDPRAKVFTNSMKTVFSELVGNNERYKGVMLSMSFKALLSDILEELTEKIGRSLKYTVEYMKMKTVKDYTVKTVLTTLMVFHNINVDNYWDRLLAGTEKPEASPEETPKK